MIEQYQDIKFLSEKLLHHYVYGLIIPYTLKIRTVLYSEHTSCGPSISGRRVELRIGRWGLRGSAGT